MQVAHWNEFDLKNSWNCDGSCDRSKYFLGTNNRIIYIDIIQYDICLCTLQTQSVPHGICKICTNFNILKLLSMFRISLYSIFFFSCDIFVVATIAIFGDLTCWFLFKFWNWHNWIYILCYISIELHIVCVVYVCVVKCSTFNNTKWNFYATIVRNTCQLNWMVDFRIWNNAKWIWSNQCYKLENPNRQIMVYTFTYAHISTHRIKSKCRFPIWWIIIICRYIKHVKQILLLSLILWKLTSSLYKFLFELSFSIKVFDLIYNELFLFIFNFHLIRERLPC